MTIFGVFFRLAGNEKYSIFDGLICLECSVTPGDDRGRRINAEVVGLITKKRHQDWIIRNTNGFKIHGFWFINMGTQEGISRKPAR